MEFRKFSASALFTGTQMLDGPWVVVTSPTGVIQSLLPPSESTGDVERLEGILCPGFVNCHCHLELSHLKGSIARNTGLVDFILEVLRLRRQEPAQILEAMDQAEAQMREAGIVAVGDIANTAASLERRPRADLAYYHFIEVTGWLPSMAQERFDQGVSLLEKFSKPRTEAGARVSLNPHAPYSISPALWDLLSNTFAKKTITMHNQEALWENELFLKGTGEGRRLFRALGIDHPGFHPSGATSLKTCLPSLKKASRLLLVHNTHTTDADLQEVQQRLGPDSVYFCLCPNANRYIEGSLPDLNRMRERGCQLVLGTDSLASNSQLSILEEMRTLAAAFPQIPLSEMLGWATLQGARALELEQELGSLQPGKRPGLLVLEGLGPGGWTAGSRVRRIL